MSVTYQIPKYPEMADYKKAKATQEERFQNNGLQRMYEAVKNNPNLFDREYYIHVLFEKGMPI
jgi:hypothetical protein